MTKGRQRGRILGTGGRKRQETERRREGGKEGERETKKGKAKTRERNRLTRCGKKKRRGREEEKKKGKTGRSEIGTVKRCYRRGRRERRESRGVLVLLLVVLLWSRAVFCEAVWRHNVECCLMCCSGRGRDIQPITHTSLIPPALRTKGAGRELRRDWRD